ncbi:mechanosensitive ion channel domain-containing protein [Pseudoroseicyclus tamaricis]|uniref:Small-conductance mechanosensitive channel n=1 Tax=Pseudoroseicyclus tamaricis TaxID=2705421 RepID=A0A6B2JUT4_9RHOB|nr:mechanosensitive ion channel domain-containing protein [Pseudoroseicyclus tamaricis]NDU99943.1 mechanosensitive ion channel [Pseudoroseicyclus tamaricis]
MPLIRLLLCLCLLAAPLAAQEVAPTGPIAAEADGASDAAIAARIRDIIGALGNYADVSVDVSGGIVTFRGTTDSLAEAEMLSDLAARVEGVVAIRNEAAETADLGRKLDPAFERFQARMWQVYTALPLILIAVLVFAVIVGLGTLLSRRRQPWERLAPNAFIADLYRQAVLVVFIIVAIVLALDVADASALLGTILGAAGIVGLAVGFAVRDTVENYIASVMLSIRQPFRPNDIIEIGGDEGKVIRLTSRATIILSFDGNHIRIPNATVFKSRIVNYTQNAERRFVFTLTVDPSVDLMDVTDLAVQTVQALPFVLPTPGAQAWLGEVTPSGIQVTTAGWIDQRETSILKARGEAMRQVMLAFTEGGIAMPNDTYTLQIAGTPPSVPEPEEQEEKEGAAPATPARPSAPVEEPVAPVTPDQEGELDRIVDAERGRRQEQDLLNPHARQE